MQLMRTLDEHPLPMLADDDHREEYDTFRWVIPKEALFQATDDAIESGLLSKIEIGTKKNIRSLTSVRLTFNNGRKEFVSPRFGVNDESKLVNCDNIVHKLTACHLRD